VTELLNRRALLTLAGTAAAGVTLGSGAVAVARESLPAPATEPIATTPQQASKQIGKVYQRESVQAGGVWNSFVTVADPAGALLPAVEDKPDEAVEALSVNKIAVAAAVLDKVDRGLLQLTQTVEVSEDIIAADGDGIFRLDRAFPSQVTIGHVLAAMLTVSDDTAVRLCGLLAPAAEINEILVAKGFPKTQVTPVENPNRFFLGKTTPRETHGLLQKLVQGALLSPASTEHLLGVLRSPIAFTDGIRRTMSSAERLRIATKAGFFSDGRHEAGIIFTAGGKPVLTYALFARRQAGAEDFGATHPAVEARAVMGRTFLDTVDRLGGAASSRTHKAPAYRQYNGG
jgi:beta-lactamase class A